MLKAIQRFLTIIFLIAGTLFFLYQGLLYVRSRSLMPQGMTIAGVDVSGLTREEAADLLYAQYMAPLIVYHREERAELPPEEVGFQLDMDAMFGRAEEWRAQQDFWKGFLGFLIGRSLEPVQIELNATHDRESLLHWLQTYSSFLDEPAKPPQLLGDSDVFREGAPGFVTDIEASLPAVEAALYRPNDREAHLVIEDQEAPRLDMTLLEANIRNQLAAFDGLGSVFIMDLETGDELSINADVAMSGLSIVKIPILLEVYRAIDFAPTPDQTKLISETAILSGDFSANLLLDVVAGQNNAYLGADILTESMHRLGLVNTFIVTPYEEPNRAGRTTLATPANSRTDISTFPDPAMQTTAEDMGTLLSMIYHCSHGQGALLAVYPDQLTAEECQAILDVLVLNTEGNLIRYGVPEEVRVSHKHGWAGNTHGDAGIVFSPGGDYVIVEYLTQPNSDWLVIDVSFPILREISRAAYNYFNVNQPNLENPADRAAREAAAREAAEAAESAGTDSQGQ
ncbi:MAG: serine hydrolase [Anaerolineae bacterium]